MIYKRDNHLNNYITSPATVNGLEATIDKIHIETKKGKNHILIRKYQQLYGDNLSSNINIPYVKDGIVRDLLVINNPDDAERLAYMHVKKHPILEPLLYNSIISTTDAEDWREQRQNYQHAFNVSNELKKIIPISVKRAEYCSQLLWGLSGEGVFDTKTSININDFFLNETMAQLQLAMFGFSNDFQQKTNKQIRETFSGKRLDYAKEYFVDFLEELTYANGPLSKAFNTRIPKNKKEQFGNAIIFSFAGHDTTAHTLSWLIYELCRHPDIQYTLQCEVDLFWKQQKERPIAYGDFKKLPFMTRCIMETLRLWTPIPNGTYRELIEDDYIIGANNEPVFVAKGTYIQIPNWTRHRNPLLWGDDVDVFNPYRDFRDDELWNDTVINTYNPSSARFSPFTYGPRDCIGKNFSQIEMRIILLHLLKDYSFSLTPDQQKNAYNQDEIGFNKFTFGPRDIYDYNKLGLYVNVKKRIFNSSL
jgi:cytochrome P450